MKQVLKQMLNNYNINNLEDKKNAIKEVVQEIVLCGLSRAGFFKDIAFYGGTALRIFYQLDRFSEDLDFSLCSPNKNFDLTKYFNTLQSELKSLGLDFLIEEKWKTEDSLIKSAFLKGNTKELILSFYENTEDVNLINKNELIKIKFEIDINPPTNATYETKFKLLPSPYQVKLYDLSSLFAGKIHACLCRHWKTRIKGRDFYDYVFFLSINAKVNLQHLKSRLVESEAFKEEDELTIDKLKILLNNRFKTIDFEQAKMDVYPFIKDKSKLDCWNVDFFIQITENIKAK